MLKRRLLRSIGASILVLSISACVGDGSGSSQRSDTAKSVDNEIYRLASLSRSIFDVDLSYCGEQPENFAGLPAEGRNDDRFTGSLSAWSERAERLDRLRDGRGFSLEGPDGPYSEQRMFDEMPGVSNDPQVLGCIPNPISIDPFEERQTHYDSLKLAALEEIRRNPFRRFADLSDENDFRQIVSDSYFLLGGERAGELPDYTLGIFRESLADKKSVLERHATDQQALNGALATVIQFAANPNKLLGAHTLRPDDPVIEVLPGSVRGAYALCAGSLLTMLQINDSDRACEIYRPTGYRGIYPSYYGHTLSVEEQQRLDIGRRACGWSRGVSLDDRIALLNSAQQCLRETIEFEITHEFMHRYLRHQNSDQDDEILADDCARVLIRLQSGSSGERTALQRSALIRAAEFPDLFGLSEDGVRNIRARLALLANEDRERDLSSCNLRP